MMPVPAERRKLLPLLDELARAVEELLLTGLTTASEATRQALHVSFQEASRLRLLRLGSTLRIANEELGRFTRNEATFSRRRLCFFLNRSWHLSRGLARALREDDAGAFDRLVWTAASRPVERLEVVTLGVAKRVVPGAFCAFEFRLRLLREAGPVPAGSRLVWSCVFPSGPGVEIPPEGYLHFPQKQKFNAHIFLEGKVVAIERAAVALEEWGGRINLTDDSTVTAGKEFTDWDPLLTWEPEPALRRIEGHRPGPLDLDVEMQEEVVFRDWQVAEPGDGDEGQVLYPLTCGPVTCHAVAPAGPEGKALRTALDALRKKRRRPPLFGLLHYERCRLLLQPLAVVGQRGPEQLMISDEKVDRAALLKTLSF